MGGGDNGCGSGLSNIQQISYIPQMEQHLSFGLMLLRLGNVTIRSWRHSFLEGGSLIYSSLVPRPHTPPGKKRSGEQSRISWAYYPNVVMTNEIARSVIIT